MAENTKIKMRDQLAATLPPLVDALTGVNVHMRSLHEASVDTELAHWEELMWRSADHLANPNGPVTADWSKTMGLEAAARAWSRAAGAYTLYCQLPMASREDTFGLFIAPVSSNLAKWRAGVSWSVKG